MDSKGDFSQYEEFILGEDRYRSLEKISKDHKQLLAKNKKEAEERYEYYESLANKSKNEE